MRVNSAVNVSELPDPSATAVLLVGSEFVRECECECEVVLKVDFLLGNERGVDGGEGRGRRVDVLLAGREWVRAWGGRIDVVGSVWCLDGGGGLVSRDDGGPIAEEVFKGDTDFTRGEAFIGELEI